MFLNYKADGTFNWTGWDKEAGWLLESGEYQVEGNKLIWSGTMYPSLTNSDELILTEDRMVLKSQDYSEKTNYRVKTSFDIKGNYSYLNSVARVVPAEGKTALQLPEGITFQGNTAIPVEMLQGERIIEAAKSFFADATFAADGKLEHKINGETKHKNYVHNGNSLAFNLYEGSDVYKVNATAFPDEDGDRLFIIMPKQGAWMGGFVELIEKENAGLKMTEEQIRALETEFLTTFDTFTVILSLSKK